MPRVSRLLILQCRVRAGSVVLRGAVLKDQYWHFMTLAMFTNVRNVTSSLSMPALILEKTSFARKKFSTKWRAL